ncbi:hypothetical protein AAY473_008889 [Plecturocebus cupreus]
MPLEAPGQRDTVDQEHEQHEVRQRTCCKFQFLGKALIQNPGLEQDTDTGPTLEKLRTQVGGTEKKEAKIQDDDDDHQTQQELPLGQADVMNPAALVKVQDATSVQRGGEGTRISPCRPGLSLVALSWLTAGSVSQAQVILPPRPPKDWVSPCCPDCLKRLGSSDPTAPASQSAAITDVSHCTWPKGSITQQLPPEG